MKVHLQWYYYNHLNQAMPLVILTEDEQIVEKYGNKSAGVFIMRTEDYLTDFYPTFQSILKLYYSLAAVNNEANESGRWTFGRFTCDLYLFLNFILCSASIYNLCVVSGDRYLAVTSPLNYLSRMNESRVKQIIGVSWFCALLLAGFVTYGTHASKENGVNCSIWGLRYEYSVFVLVIAYILPVFFSRIREYEGVSHCACSYDQNTRARDIAGSCFDVYGESTESRRRT